MRAWRFLIKLTPTNTRKLPKFIAIMSHANDFAIDISEYVEALTRAIPATNINELV